jgi:uncharacterized protein YrrD
MDVKSLKGIAVVSIEDGEKLGTIDDMIFNLDSRHLIAFRLARTRFFRGERNLIAMADVESVGSDAIMVRNRSRLRDERHEREFSERPDLAKLTSLPVVTEHGGYVGTLASVDFDPETGAITHLGIAAGGLRSVLGEKKQVPAADIISIGADVVVVPNRYGPDDDEEEPANDQRPEVIQ